MSQYNPKIHHRKSIRLKGYDYGQAGLYFITLCCQDRICRFGNIKDGQMQLNQYGQIAHDAWLQTPEIRPNIELGNFIIMPNHMHGIIRITGRGESHSPNNNESNAPQPGRDESHSPNNNESNVPQPGWGESHSPNNNESNAPQPGRGESHSPNNKESNAPQPGRDELHSSNNQEGVCDTPPPNPKIDNEMGVCDTPQPESPQPNPFIPKSPSNNIGAIVRGYKSSVTKQIKLLGFTGQLWQRNYYEHIIRNEQSFQTISDYIFNNPAKWGEDKFYKK